MHDNVLDVRHYPKISNDQALFFTVSSQCRLTHRAKKLCDWQCTPVPFGVTRLRADFR